MEQLTPEEMDEKINAQSRESEFVLGVLGLRVDVLEQSMSRIASVLFSFARDRVEAVQRFLLCQLGGLSDRKLSTKQVKRDS